MTSPLASWGSHSRFWASVAPWTRARARISGRVMSDPPTPSEPHDSSSVAIRPSPGSSPSRHPAVENPPYSSGIDNPKVPSSPGRRSRPRGCRRSGGGRARPRAAPGRRQTDGRCPAPARSQRRGGASPPRRPTTPGTRRCGTHAPRRRRRRGPRARPPRGLSPEQARRHVVHRVGDEGGGDPALDLAVLAVVDDGGGGLDRGRCVRQVVGRDLVVIDLAAGAEVAAGGGDHVACQRDGIGGCSVHGAPPYWADRGASATSNAGWRRRR